MAIFFSHESETVSVSGKLLLPLTNTLFLGFGSAGLTTIFLCLATLSREEWLLLVGLSGKIAAGLRQQSHYLSLASRESWPYFPLSLVRPHRKYGVQQFFYCFVCIHCRGNVFTKPLSSKVSLLWLHYSGFQVSCQITPPLRLLSKLRGCNIGIIDGSDLWSTPLKLAPVPRYTYQVS
jgi:hypothetical protein